MSSDKYSQFMTHGKILDKQEIKIKNKIFNQKRLDLLNKEPKNGDFILDKTIQVTKKVKSNIWNKSNTHDYFDFKIFKLDMLGLVCIKRDLLNKYQNKNNEIFNYEFEHVLSYSHGGKSTEDNVRILNKNINRNKKVKELYKFNINELTGLCYLHGISFNELLSKLETDLHNTCKEYNLFFIKRKSSYWSIKDHPYNNEYKSELYNNIKDNISDYDENYYSHHNDKNYIKKDDSYIAICILGVSVIGYPIVFVGIVVISISCVGYIVYNKNNQK